MVYTVATAFGRAQFENVGPWIAGVAMTAVLFPYLIWLDLSAGISFLDLATIAGNLRTWGWLVVALLLSHAGMAILIVLGRGTIDRARAARRRTSSARRCIRRRAASSISSRSLRSWRWACSRCSPAGRRISWRAPLVVMSGLAVIVAAGERIRIEHQYLIGYAWIALIVLPPLLVALAIVFQPGSSRPICGSGGRPPRWGSSSATASRAAPARPLAVVAGDQALASLVALGAPSRPSLYLDAVPDDRSRVTRQDIADKGAVIVWPATDTAGRPPPEIARQFPDLASRCRALSRGNSRAACR